MRIFFVIISCCWMAGGAISETSIETRKLPTLGETIDFIFEEDDVTLDERSGRKLFKKLHSGAAFVAGVKLGSYLAGKGLNLGSGNVATAHTFQLFGKSISTALSVSYGGNPLTAPFHDPVDNSSVPERLLDSNILHIAVIEPPPPEIVDQLKTIARISQQVGNSTRISNDGSPIKQNISHPNEIQDQQFKQLIHQHGHRVSEFNRRMFGNKTRTNSRF